MVVVTHSASTVVVVVGAVVVVVDDWVVDVVVDSVTSGLLVGVVVDAELAGVWVATVDVVVVEPGVSSAGGTSMGCSGSSSASVSGELSVITSTGSDSTITGVSGLSRTPLSAASRAWNVKNETAAVATIQRPMSLALLMTNMLAG